jgi:hypothetical protein
MEKYSKIRGVVNSYDTSFKKTSSSDINASKLISSKFITFDDYSNNYIDLHKKLSEFFDENYYSQNYNSTHKNKFIDFINSIDISDANNIIYFVNRVNSGTVKEFIEAYTGETKLCYSLNKWLRDCESNQYDDIKYFAGPFSYTLYKFANDNKEQGIYKTKTFYRKMTIKLSDYYLYKIFLGELICFPAFTSTSEKDISKYNFPTAIAKDINNLSPNDISVVLIIKYKCKNSSNPTPCVNATEYSVCKSEREFIFPPFSFFKIEKIEENKGTTDSPNIIYMSTPNKRNLLEFGLKNNKTIHYDREDNELYYS